VKKKGRESSYSLTPSVSLSRFAPRTYPPQSLTPPADFYPQAVPSPGSAMGIPWGTASGPAPFSFQSAAGQLPPALAGFAFETPSLAPMVFQPMRAPPGGVSPRAGITVAEAFSAIGELPMAGGDSLFGAVAANRGGLPAGGIAATRGGPDVQSLDASGDRAAKDQGKVSGGSASWLPPSAGPETAGEPAEVDGAAAEGAAEAEEAVKEEAVEESAVETGVGQEATLREVFPGEELTVDIVGEAGAVPSMNASQESPAPAQVPHVAAAPEADEQLLQPREEPPPFMSLS
jgi:hypothetical protein